MDDSAFNPFEDRFSRDLRNDLSSAFSEAVETGNTDGFGSTIAKFEQMNLAPHYKSYLGERKRRYERALAIIKTDQHPIFQAAVLWNQGLYFEVHEVLEHSWYSATGNHKLILQALIRAAGVYIKREYGFDAAAKKIAAKALPVIERNRNLLAPHFDPQSLITALRDEIAEPPKLTLNQ